MHLPQMAMRAGSASPYVRELALAQRVRESSLEQIAEGGFAKYFKPFTGKPLGSREQSWTAAVVLDWLAAGEPSAGAA